MANNYSNDEILFDGDFSTGMNCTLKNKDADKLNTAENTLDEVETSQTLHASEIASEDEVVTVKDTDELPPGVDPEELLDKAEKIEKNENEDKSEEIDSDVSDDVNVVIGDVKTTSRYIWRNLKMTNSRVNNSKPAGKFSIEDFESFGVINGVPGYTFNLNFLEDKPWRKPGADISDYFNYGFNEITWSAYCERQKRMGSLYSVGEPTTATSVSNENSKYYGNGLESRKAGPPPGRRMIGHIDVIGVNSSLPSRRSKENLIEITTTDTAAFPDMYIPLASTSFNSNDMSILPPGTDNYSDEFFNIKPEPRYGEYEPTRDSQWGEEVTSEPKEVMEVVQAPVLKFPPFSNYCTEPPALFMAPPPNVYASVQSDSGTQLDYSYRQASAVREYSRSRSEKPDRHYKRSHRQERSHRHKSNSRSPRHRSHRKKKDRRHRANKSD